jgi:vitellogenic carboxypeptidase-like protein
VAKLFHEFLVKFNELNIVKIDKIFLTGESYAGKFIPSIGHYLLTKSKFNLKGVGIGNGLVDPDT